MSGGRVVVVTGGRTGIGLAICDAFATLGDDVVALDVDDEDRERVLARLRSLGARDAMYHRVDVSEPDGVADAFDRVAHRYGRVDVLVNNAGIREIRNSLTCTPSEFAHVVDVNLNGAFYCAQAAARLMSRGGAIVNVASAAGLIGVPNRPAYVASKHGLVGLTKVLARDFAPANIRVNAVCPGMVLTEMTAPYATDPALLDVIAVSVPMARVGDAASVADAVVFLAGPGAGFITGAALPVDGGFVAEKTFDWTGTSAAFVDSTDAVHRST